MCIDQMRCEGRCPECRGEAAQECDHVWQPHDAYGENCINCGLWRGSAYDHAETDPAHGGKIWSPA